MRNKLSLMLSRLARRKGLLGIIALCGGIVVVMCVVLESYALSQPIICGKDSMGLDDRCIHTTGFDIRSLSGDGATHLSSSEILSYDEQVKWLKSQGEEEEVRQAEFYKGVLITIQVTRNIALGVILLAMVVSRWGSRQQMGREA